MHKPRIQNTVAAAGLRAALTVGAVAVLTVYYRLAWPFLVLILCLSYLGCSYGWTWLSCRYFTAESTGMPENIFPGDNFTWEFRFANRWAFPLIRCGIRFFLPPVFSCQDQQQLTYTIESQDSSGDSAPGFLPVYWKRGDIQRSWFPAQEEFAVRLQVTAGLRGYYYLPPVRFFAGDVSGLYQGFKQLGQEQYLTVFPNPIGSTEIQRILSYEENRREDIFGLEDRYETLGVRDYQLNDPPKNINWYATARTNALKANMYQRKDSLYCLVVLDLTAGFQPVTEPDRDRSEDPQLEKAISYACGLALTQLEQGSQTAFITNAPLVNWEKNKADRLHSPGVRRKRTRKITGLSFSGGTEQEQKILRLCASVDDTARASMSEQERMWARIREIPPHTLVYLVCYHTPPANWKNYEHTGESLSFPEPAEFYTPQRLGELSSSRVRLLNFSGEGWTS